MSALIEPKRGAFIGTPHEPDTRGCSLIPSLAASDTHSQGAAKPHRTTITY
jgi:hypothetical protein